MKLIVNCAQPAGRLEHFWESTGFTPASLLLDADMKQTLAYVGATPRGGVKHVRIHYLLDLVDVTDALGPSPRYDWSRFDAGFDVLVGNRLRPFFELMGSPGGAFTNFMDRAQLVAWRRLVADVARHCIQRYGRDEVRSWYFETWNEPDIPNYGTFFREPQALCDYYDACCAGLADADDSLCIGGPGTCRDLSPTLKRFLAHCDGEPNSLTGGPVRLDFISVHVKGVRAHKEDLDPDTDAIIERTRQIVDYVRQNHPSLAGVPFMNDECDPQTGWWDLHTWHARSYYAGWIARCIHRHLDEVRGAMGVPFSLLSNDNGFIGSWGNRTQLTRYPQIDISRIRTGGQEKRDPNTCGPFTLIKKPALNVMAALAMLGTQRVQVLGGDAELGAIATASTDEVAVLLWHSRDRVMSSGQASVSLRLEGLPFDEAAVAQWRIDDEHGDAFTQYARAGAPDRIDDDLLAILRDNMELTEHGPIRVRKPAGRAMSLNIRLPLHSAHLVLLAAKPAQAPAKVTGLRHERYTGPNGTDDVLLVWDGMPGGPIRSFEVFAGDSPSGGLVRLNRRSLLASAYMHSRAAGTGRLFYRVRAVDFWGRFGELSDVMEVL
jgi:L-iduronidase